MKMMLTIAVVAIIIHLNVKAFAQSSESTTQQVQTLQDKSIKLIIVPDKPSYELDPVIIHFTVKNISSEPVNIIVLHPIYPLIQSISIIGPDDNPAPLTRWGKIQLWLNRGSGGKVLLKPGESLETGILPISRLFDMTLSGNYIVKIITVWGTASCKVIIQN
jgi:hypothetical protein